MGKPIRFPATGRGSALLALLLWAAGCGLITDADRPDPCPQTYEFGNYGCARIVVMFEAPAGPLPPSSRYVVLAVPVRDRSGLLALAPYPAPGAVPLELTLRSPLPAGAGDTLSVWAVARLLDETPPLVVGPVPVFAADSALRVVRFAAVGAVPRTDTVRLTLRRP